MWGWESLEERSFFVCVCVCVCMCVYVKRTAVRRRAMTGGARCSAAPINGRILQYTRILPLSSCTCHTTYDLKSCHMCITLKMSHMEYTRILPLSSLHLPYHVWSRVISHMQYTQNVTYVIHSNIVYEFLHLPYHVWSGVMSHMQYTWYHVTYAIHSNITLKFFAPAMPYMNVM